MPISRGLFWQAAAADKASKGSGDNAAVLEAALLYLEADKCIEAACASVRVAANVQATLEKKQGAVLKRLRALRKTVGADALDAAWATRRVATATADAFFPAGGLYWQINGHAEFGQQQGPVDRAGMAELMQMEVSRAPSWLHFLHYT